MHRSGLDLVPLLSINKRAKEFMLLSTLKLHYLHCVRRRF